MLNKLSQRLGIPVERLEALSWASPWLVFLIPQFLGAFTLQPWGLVAATVSLLLIFIGTYLLIWLNCTPIPPYPNQGWLLTSSLLVLAGISLGLSPILHSALLCISFIIPPIVLLLPFSSMMRAISALFLGLGLWVFFGFTRGWWDSELLAPLGFSTIGTFALLVMIRTNIRREHEERLNLVADKFRATASERERIASDLHDHLGQTLTAIATLSQLSVKLLDANQPEQARTQVLEIQNLGRDALEQMRRVVREQSSLHIAEELAQARLLFDASAIAVEVQYENQNYAYPAEVENFIAHLLREGSTNVVRHSHASWCRILLKPERVEIRNNGVGETPPSTKGRGLMNLRHRAPLDTEVVAGPEGEYWVLRANFTSEKDS